MSTEPTNVRLTRNKISGLIILAVALVVFNVIAFAIPVSRGAVFWIGYGFTLFAIIAAGAALLYAMGREGLKSKFYGLPLSNVVYTYLAAQYSLGVAEVRMPFMPAWLALILNVLVLGGFLIGFVAVDAAVEEIKRIDVKVGQKVFYLRSLQADVESVEARAGSAALKKQLQGLAEAIRYSDPMSSDQLGVIENTIQIRVMQLQESVGGDNEAEASGIVAELMQLVADRNRRAKLLKGTGV